LAAARMLEQDVENFVKQKKFDEAARIHAIINHLRTQARQLLVP
jgi:protein-arginine kinase activator protein McsA